MAKYVQKHLVGEGRGEVVFCVPRVKHVEGKFCSKNGGCLETM